MDEKDLLTNYEHYKTEIDEIQWFVDKIEQEPGQITSKNIFYRNNTKIIATITSRTTKIEIRQMIASGIRIFIIKCALFKAEEYTTLIKKVSAELKTVNETPTFIFDLQGPIPAVSNIYSKSHKVEKLSVRSGQIVKITNQNKPSHDSDLIVVDKKIYSSVSKGDNILFNSSIIMKVIHLEKCNFEKEQRQTPAEGKDIHYFKEVEPHKRTSQCNLDNGLTQSIKKIEQIFNDQDGSINKGMDESFQSMESKSRFLMNCLSQLELSSEYKISYFKDKDIAHSRPELYFDFNQGDIMKNKQNLLNREYKRIIQSKQFAAQDEANDKNSPSIGLDKHKSYYFQEGERNDDSPFSEIKANPIFNENGDKKKRRIPSYSLKERQMLLDRGFRFNSITAPESSPNKSDKKIVVCEVETPGDLNLLSEVYVMGKQNNFPGPINTLGAKEITDIGKATHMNVTILCVIANNAGDIKEVRKILSDEAFESKCDDESDPNYRNYSLHKIKILAKIVTNSSIFNFDEILTEADGIVLDPNAISLKIDYDDQCLIDKYIIEKCKLKNKPIFIKSNCFTTKTRSLFSASDITSIDDCINSGIDGFILNEEFPLEFFCTLKRMILDIERLSEGKDNYEKISKTVNLNLEEIRSHNSLKSLHAFNLLETLFDSAIKLSYEANISIIFLYCDSYYTAKRLSKYRPNCRIICATDNPNKFNFIRMFRGVSAMLTSHKNISLFNEALFNE